LSKNGRIAILTGGGDCPGINAVIRAVAKKAILEHNIEVIGLLDGFDGLVRERYRKLSSADVSGILTLGGTILGTSNTANPYRWPTAMGPDLQFADASPTAMANFHKLAADCLVCIGGDGTLNIANRLFQDGLPVVGVPKTIDNDLHGTDITFGFDTAVNIATEGIDRLHTTAQSHHRVIVVEVMGRNAGWIALHAGVAGGADVILIPEIPYDISVVVGKVMERNRSGKRFSIIVVAEGGIGFVLGAQLEAATGIETRTVVMGHLLRGGTPTPFDRILATRLGTRAVDMIEKASFGSMPGIRGSDIVDVPLEDVARGQRTVLPDDPLVASARSLTTCFGDQ